MLTVSRVEPSKRPFDFVDLASKVASYLSNVEFIWAGEGTMMRVVSKRASECATVSIRFVGHVSDEEKQTLLERSDVYVSTSESEGFALTPGEALLKGVPVVVYDLPVYREIYGDNLFYVKRFDTDEFARKVVYCIQHREEVEEKVRRGREFVKSMYSREAVGGKVRNALLKIFGD
ncbi:MAG: glycosyltransferase family 4 protein, partial [Thermoprotei archaeon]